MSVLRVFVACVLVVFCLGTLVGCSQPADGQAPPDATESN